MYAEMVNRFSATRLGSWLVKHVAAHVDPVIFRWSNGRFTCTGKPTVPMLLLTVPGRTTGELRSVQLAYHRDGDDYLVVASAMGAERHPAWRYNLDAAGRATIQLRGQQLEVNATVLSDDEKAVVWDQVATTIPQMHTYVQRTDRNIRVFRLTPVPPT